MDVVVLITYESQENMSSIQSKQQKVIEDFARFSSWEDKYAHIISLGKSLESLPEEFKTEQNRVKGCQSQVWLHANLDVDKVIFRADSDAIIVRGLVAILVHVFSDSTPDEIMLSNYDFLTEIGLMSNLSQSRANGVAAMLKQIRNYAIAFGVLLQQRGKK